MATLSHLRIGIMGLGVAGRAMAQTLQAEGARLVLADDRPAPAALLTVFGPPHSLTCADAHSAVPADVFAGCDRVMVSPGVPPEHPAVAYAVAHNSAVVGEVEFIELLAPGATTVGITGTNGKSTTTSLAGVLHHSLFGQAFVGGNLGDAIGTWLGMAPHIRPTTGILELSSYQIDGLTRYRPDVAVVLNVTPDHLARYGTFERYLHSKSRLVAALGAGGTAVLNADDAQVRAMAQLTRARVLWFTQHAHLPKSLGDHAAGLVVQGGQAVPVGAVAQQLHPIALAHDTLLGQHNAYNALAALLAVVALVPPARAAAPDGEVLARRSQTLQAAYRAFAGLPHRLAYVATVRGVRYLNDSKATNDASAATAVRAMQQPFVLLVGGQDKGGGYHDLVAALGEVPAKAIVAFGAARALLVQELAASGVPLHQAARLEDACAQALNLAVPGDAVLLSPACTSFDAFHNYQHRGDTFAAWVLAQKGA